MKVKKKLDINPKRGKYFISLAKLIIPEHNLGKTTISEYPTWVHVHTVWEITSCWQWHKSQ